MHRAVRKHIDGGTCLQYGARSLNEGDEGALFATFDVRSIMMSP
jgi:hypothetical protein